ncbi:MAG: DMT family transporter [Rhodospirillales bacterium]
MGDKAGMIVLSDNLKGAALMSGSMAAFVVNDTLMKLASAHFPLFQALTLRGLFATTLIGLIAWHRGQLLVPIARADRRIIGLRTVGELGATVCFLTALFNMPLANVTAILQAAPLAVTLGAAFFLGQKVGWRRYSAISAGFVGVLIIVRPGAEGFNAFAGLALVAVLFIVLRDLSTRQLSPSIPSIQVALITAVSVTCLGALLAPTQDWAPITMPGLVYLASAACFLIFGYLFSVMTMRTGEIAFVSPFRYTVLLWAMLLGYIVFGEVLDTSALIGSAVIVVTGIYSFHRERKRRIQDREPPPVPVPPRGAPR